MPVKKFTESWIVDFYLVDENGKLGKKIDTKEIDRANAPTRWAANHVLSLRRQYQGAKVTYSIEKITNGGYEMRDDIHTLVSILAHSENAMNLAQFQRQSELETERLTQALDMLVLIHIFQSDVSYHASDIGEVVYMFAENDQAQEMYKAARGE